MSERWTNTANDKGELSEMLIQSLIETAVKRFDFPIHPIHILKWGQHFWLQTARFIPDAI